MKTIMIRQPGYMPNIGFFKKIEYSDIFVFLDDTQFSKDRPLFKQLMSSGDTQI